MSKTFLSARGCVYVVGEKKAGIYRVEGLSALRGSGHILITSVAPTEADLVLQHISINGKKILYTTGKDFGGLLINGEILGVGGSQAAVQGSPAEGSDMVKQVEDWFESSRIGVSDTPVNVSAGGKAMKAYLVAFGLGEANPELNTVSFTIQGITATPESKS